MKNKIQLLTIMCAVSTAAQAAPFNGFYLGSSAGSEARVTQYNDKSSSSNNQYTKYNVNMIGSIFTGYMHTYSHGFSVGGEIALTAPI